MGQESQLDLLPFACQRMYHAGAAIPQGWSNLGGTPEFPPVPGVYDGFVRIWSWVKPCIREMSIGDQPAYKRVGIRGRGEG
jgi:hypothetical protein